MDNFSVKEARREFSSLVTRAMHGENITISRRGKAVAQLQSIESKHSSLPSLKAFRDSLRNSGENTGATVTRLREEERY